jgi:hypothetical protein
MVALNVTSWSTNEVLFGEADATVVDVTPAPTFWTIAGEVLPVKSLTFVPPGLYVATMLKVPAVVNVKGQTAVVPAAPVTTATEEPPTQAMVVPLFVKVTDPVGLVTPEKVGVTVAVKVTCWLVAEALFDETTLVEVEVAATMIGDGVVVPLLALKLASG